VSEPLILIPGDAPTLRFAVVTPPPDSTTDGDPFDLTDYDMDFFIKRSLQDLDVAAIWHGSLNDGVFVAFQVKDGQVDVRIPHTITAALRPGRPYPWYLVLSHVVQTEKVYVVERGTFLTLFPEGT
jgi:hypothetical protein